MSSRRPPSSNLAAGPQCPLPVSDHTSVQLAHGGGGRLSQLLIERVFLEAFRNPILEGLHDGAQLELEGARLAFSTDSFVIQPRWFPGGDIGSLAVHGTVNDIAMCGARPVALSAGFILEEGLAMQELSRIAQSMKCAALEVGVPIVTGDTKVVDRGKGDGVFINTAGLGILLPGAEISPQRARPGDVVLVSGSIGMHGIAVLSVREGLRFEASVESDSAPLHDLVRCLLERVGGELHVLRDPTRGGVASALNGSTSDPSPSARRCAAPVRFWGSIRCTSPTKAAAWQSCRESARRICCRSCMTTHSGARRRSSAKW